MDSAQLQIVISAVDEASSQLGVITDQLKELGTVSDDVTEQMSAGSDATAASLDRLTATTEGVVASQTELAARVTANTEVTTANTAATAKQTAALADGSVAADTHSASFSKMGVGVGLAAAAVDYAIDKTVTSYANLQTSMVKLVTSAGESNSNLAMVTTGVQNIAKSTGTSTTDLANAMYYIESAGFHGAAALNVMTAAAKGAKDEQASALSVADATTTIMNDYGKNTYTATQAVNGMITAVSRGKTTLQLFSTSLSNVLPTAHALGISFAQTAGAVATMTAQGMTAKRATQDLNHAISSLANPTTVQTNEMLQMGLNSQTVAKNLGKEGLTGTMTELSNAILQHMGPAGLVLQSAMQNPMEAAQDAKQALAALPGPVQALAEELENGSISWTGYRTAIRALPPTMENLGSNFETTFLKTATLNTQIKAGVPSAMTYNAVMAKMTGGQNGLQAALLLSADGGKTFKNNVDAISKSMDSATNKIIGWSNVQGTFNQQMSELKEDVIVFGQQMGKVLIPMLTMVAKTLALVFAPLAELVTKFPALSAIILMVVGTFLTLITVTLIANKAFNTIQSGMKVLSDSFTFLTKILFGTTTQMEALDAASIANRTNLEGVAGGIEKIAPAAEDAEGGMGGLVGAIGAINPAVLAVGAVAAVAVPLIATHWDNVKKSVDGVFKSIGNVLGIKGTTNVGVNANTTGVGAPTNGKATGAVGSDATSIIANNQKILKLNQQLTGAQGKLGAANTVLSAKTLQLNVEYVDMISAIEKYGAGSTQAQRASAAYQAALGQQSAAQAKESAAQSKVNALSNQADNLEGKNAITLKNLEGTINAVSNAHKKLASDTNLVAAAHVNLTAKANALTTAYTLFKPNSEQVKNAAKAYAGALQSLSNRTQQVSKDHDNLKTAEKNAATWTANGDKAIKSLGLNSSQTSSLIKALKGSVDTSTTAHKQATNAATQHSDVMKTLSKNTSGAKKPFDDIITSINHSSDAFKGAKKKTDDETNSLKKSGDQAVTAMNQFNQLNTAVNNVNKGLTNAQNSPLLKGIPAHAGGVTNSPGGLALVGEQGPELVNLPAGSSVMTASQTAQVIANGQPSVSTGSTGGGGSSGPPITLNVQFTGPVMGNSSQAQQFATQIWQSLQAISRQYGLQGNLPQIGIRPV